MSSVGFLVENLGASQLGYYVCRNTNEFLGSNPSDDIICYYEHFEEECMQPNFQLNPPNGC